MALSLLEVVGDQNTSLRAQGGFPILALEASPKLDNLSVKFLVRG